MTEPQQLFLINHYYYLLTSNGTDYIKYKITINIKKMTLAVL